MRWLWSAQAISRLSTAERGEVWRASFRGAAPASVARPRAPNAAALGSLHSPATRKASRVASRFRLPASVASNPLHLTDTRNSRPSVIRARLRSPIVPTRPRTLCSALCIIDHLVHCLFLLLIPNAPAAPHLSPESQIHGRSRPPLSDSARRPQPWAEDDRRQRRGRSPQERSPRPRGSRSA